MTGFDLRVLRGDRVAFVGPNGVGKTTVLKMLIGQMAPDAGTVTLGTNLEMAVFDQTRAQLDPNATPVGQPDGRSVDAGFGRGGSGDGARACRGMWWAI